VNVPLEPVLQLFERYHEALLWVDARTLTIVHGNAAARRLLGYDIEQLKGQLITNIEASVADVLFWDEVRNGYCKPFEAVRGYYRRADETIFLVEKSLTKIETDGVPLLMISFHDAEPGRILEENLAQTSSLLAATLEATADGVLVIDLAGGILKMNRNCAQMWGLTKEVLEAGVDADVLACMERQLVDADAHRARFQAALADGSEAVFEEIRLLDGRCLEVQLTPLHIANQLAGYVLSFRDVTQRKRAELEQKKLEVQLRQQNEALAKANRVKSEFLANMSHEIRTPMHAVINLAQLCLSTALDAQQRDYVEKIYSASKSLLRIIDDILDFSKLEAGKMTLEAIDFPLQQVLDYLRDLMTPVAQQKNLALHWQVNVDAAQHFVGDPLRLGQVLLNLLSNAVKFTERGTVGLQVDARPLNDTTVELKFAVSDTGIGLSPEQCAGLFQSFSQADASTTRKYGGTGLGLAISKQLTELMHGQISVQSALGQGSTFTVTIPLKRAAGKPMDGDRAAQTSVTALPGARLLVVEDNPVNQQIARELLTRGGVTVTIANNGLECLALLEQQSFDAVLMDVQMPVLDGMETATAIRQRLRLNSLPIIAMTANAMCGDRDRCLEAGMNDYLAKPIEPRALWNTLAKWVKPRAEVAAPAHARSSPTQQMPTMRGIDLAVALKHAGDDVAFLRELLREFRATHAEDDKRLREALAAGDVTSAKRLAHTLKSVAATFGAQRLHAVAATMDAHLRDGAIAPCEALLGELTGALEEVRAAIDSDAADFQHSAVA
jgi:two-component system sensor histidine kinase/response regulator